MNIKAGEWQDMDPTQRYIEIWKTYVKTQKNNSRGNVSY